MRTVCAALAASAGLLAGGASNASVFFTFQDPGTPREVTYTQGSGGNPGTITYTSGNAVFLEVDGTQEGIGVQTYATTLAMNLTVGTASAAGAFLQAPVSGTFVFTDMGSGMTLLSGSITTGAVLTFLSTGSIVATSSNGSLVMTAGAAMLPQLNLNGFGAIVPQFDASFSLSSLSPLPLVLTPDGYIPSFTANAAFVGNAEVPTPGSAALAGIAAMFLAPRRRHR
ncbi:MAG: hypothetical protein AB7G17_12605 [Phycisphaerales bacterium]